MMRINYTNKYKQNWDESYRRLEAWWQCEETDRPLVFSSVPKPLSEHKGERIKAKDSKEAARFDLDAEIRLNNTRYYLENTLFMAESVPYAFSNFANLLGMLCAQAGGKLNYTPDTFTAWMEEEDGLFDRPLPQVGVPCPELQFVTDMIKKNHDAFGYDAVLGANPMLDPATTLSLMRGSGNFLYDLIDREEDVFRWLGRLGDFHRQAISAYRAARAAVGRREEYNWTGAWSPGDMDAIQCDVCTMLSPEMFRKFILPEMEREASFFDYTIWHLDGTDEFKHLDDILAIPNLHAIQFVDEKARDLTEFSHIWEKILRSKKSLLFHCKSQYAPALTRKLGHKGLSFLFPDVRSEDEMEKLLKTLSES
ncbi:hypothetical protein FACS189447_00370 [Spirochaetia bacterium]|nr:hypothetical protein FACS189447_00370 [Spirochaetia bacterium]